MAIKKSILIRFLFLFVSIPYWVFAQTNEPNYSSEKIKIVLRQIGNELLLLNKDSTSLILPVQELEDDSFQVSFQKELRFEPSQLVTVVKSNFRKVSFPNNYRVQVLQCTNGEVAYSYEMSENLEKTIIPCSDRILPKQCYHIQVRFLDNKKPKKNLMYYYIFIPLILGFLYREFYLKREKKVKNDSISDNQKTLGSFLFYPDQNKLVKKAKEIKLSKKECELLQLFVSKPNQIIKREELTKKVWEDNGVFVGRSLDTYISKLRKKLEEDNSVKLINIHGVGYKLEC